MTQQISEIGTVPQSITTVTGSTDTILIRQPVDDLFLSDNAIIFATTLKGPESERKGDKPTYPYIVVKMENMDKEIIYK